MGAGYHGGFGATTGSRREKIITLDSALVGKTKKGRDLADVMPKVKKEPGYTDVAVHGAPDHISVYRKINGEEVEIPLTHRNLAKFLKSDKGYIKGKVRLLSCNTGNSAGTFAQDLANKMGVKVMAPSDTLHIWPDGRMVIGPNPYVNSGKWLIFSPKKKGKKV